MWREILAEISARGWRAFVFGPEIFLALPVLSAAMGAAAIAWALAKENKRRRSDDDTRDL